MASPVPVMGLMGCGFGTSGYVAFPSLWVRLFNNDPELGPSCHNLFGSSSGIISIQAKQLRAPRYLGYETEAK